ncbi:MAG: CotH kinase family protein [Lachnospiraceae bacterium]|nr:CotH kinase family protein [Lachnospiraceae bacterium]
MRLQEKVRESAKKRLKRAIGTACLLLCLAGGKTALAAEEEVFVPSTIPAPEFSAEGGFYEESFELTLTVPEGTTVYYTLDGSDPVAGAEDTYVYTEPIAVQAREADVKEGKLLRATVVRAVSVDTNGEYGDVQTHTYFVTKGMKSRYNVPVVSIVTDPENLYDRENGIFSNPTESGREWERPAYFEYFTPEGTRALALNVGLRIHGGYSRNMTIKSFRVYARSEYDTAKNFKYDFFSDNVIAAYEKNGEEQVIDKFKRLVLRTGGNEGDAWEATYFRDILTQSLMTNSLLDLQACQPTMTYVNGSFYGILNIRERQDDRYLSSHYNCKEDEVAVVGFEYNTDEDGKVILPPEGEKVFEIVSEEGPEEAVSYFEEAYNFVISNDLGDAENYAKALGYFDIENFIDYMCLELYSGNTDWPHNNCKMWFYIGEPSEEYGLDGKIRILVYDTDFGFGLYGHRSDENTLAPMVSDAGSKEPYRDVLTCLLRAFLQNEEFKQQFAGRFFDLLNVNFAPNTVIAKIDALEDVYEPLVVEQYLKYGQKFPYYSNVETAREFAKIRANAMRLYLVKDLGLGGRIDVTLKTEEELHGSVNINTVTVTNENFDADGKWTGKVLKDTELTIEAVPEEGYTFVGWEGSVTGGEAKLVFAAGEYSKNFTLTPVFAAVGEEKDAEEDAVTPSPEPEENQSETAEQKPSENEDKQPAEGTVNGDEGETKKPNVMPWIILAVLLVAAGVAVVIVKKVKNE